MLINRPFFFDHLQEKLYPKGLQQSQMDRHTALLDAWETSAEPRDDRWIAYMLGTAYHETARTLQPVRETLASTDEEAAARLETAWKKGQLPWVHTPYWRPDDDGKYWFGRGLVQLTHRANYAKMGVLIDQDLLSDPNQALDRDTAIQIMFVGMDKGAFTGKKLADYFSATSENWKGARQIINGTESDALVASNALSYYAAISYVP